MFKSNYTLPDNPDVILLTNICGMIGMLEKQCGYLYQLYRDLKSSALLHYLIFPLFLRHFLEKNIYVNSSDLS